MIEIVEITGVGKYKIDEDFRKYAEKRISKVDKFLPKKNRKGVIAKVVISEVNHPHGNKYELSAAIDVPGGKVIAAKDEAGNVFAGIDILEQKLIRQARRYKLEQTPHHQKPKKGLFKKIFFKK